MLPSMHITSHYIIIARNAARIMRRPVRASNDIPQFDHSKQEAGTVVNVPTFYSLIATQQHQHLAGCSSYAFTAT